MFCKLTAVQIKLLSTRTDTQTAFNTMNASKRTCQVPINTIQNDIKHFQNVLVNRVLRSVNRNNKRRWEVTHYTHQLVLLPPRSLLTEMAMFSITGGYWHDRYLHVLVARCNTVSLVVRDVGQCDNYRFSNTLWVRSPECRMKRKPIKDVYIPEERPRL